MQRYLMPMSAAGRLAARFFNSIVAALAKLGVSVLGSRVLYVRGRKSGERREVPVNLLAYGGENFLVAPRGHTQWVRNLRAAGEGKLQVGRKVEKFTAHELADAEKPRVLREYLRRWRIEVAVFFEGVGPDATDAQLLAIAPGYPVFRIDIERPLSKRRARLRKRAAQVSIARQK
jgi:deazaflavin-dependent oxidoreductase (nitroreductase family)